jgi:hypothetical protein
MRMARKIGLSGLLVLFLNEWSSFAASVPNFPPNPVGEKLYRTQLYHETLFPVLVLICVLLVVYIVHRISHKDGKSDSPNC